MEIKKNGSLLFMFKIRTGVPQIKYYYYSVIADRAICVS